MRDDPEGGDNPTPLRMCGKAQAKLKHRTSRLDVFTGMAFSNTVMFSNIAATAETLRVHIAFSRERHSR